MMRLGATGGRRLWFDALLHFFKYYMCVGISIIGWIGVEVPTDIVRIPAFG